MKLIRTKIKEKENFIEFFLEKEKTFLYNMNPVAFKHEDFRFYMEWFIYSIDDSLREKYDIKERFEYFFTNNYSLNIIFFVYIISDKFINKVIEDIEEYKRLYKKEHIYG